MAPARTISRRLPSGRRLNASTTLMPGSSSRIKPRRCKPDRVPRLGPATSTSNGPSFSSNSPTEPRRAGHDLGARPELVGHVLDLLGEFLTSIEDEDLWVPQRRS